MKMVYLDANVPEDGQNELDHWPGEMRGAITADEAVLRGLRQPTLASIFCVDSPELVEWIEVRFTPHPMETYTEPVPRGTTRSSALPRVYIHCTGGPDTTTPLFAPFAGRTRANGWEVHELAAGHMAIVTASQDVAAILLELVS